MDITVKGIVLNTKDYKDNDKLLTILTLEKGKILVKARGVKKSSSKLKAFCQSFCFADFELIESKAGYVLTGVNEIENFFGLTCDIDKFSYAFAVLEIVNKLCQENQIYVDIFLDTLRCLKQMNFENTNPTLSLAKFIINILNFEGVNLNLSKCNSCKSPLVSDIYLHMSTGEVLCIACKNFNCEQIDKAVFATLKILANCEYSKLSTIKLSNQIISNTLKTLLKNLKHKFDIYVKSIEL